MSAVPVTLLQQLAMEQQMLLFSQFLQGHHRYQQWSVEQRLTQQHRQQADLKAMVDATASRQIIEEMKEAGAIKPEPTAAATAASSANAAAAAAAAAAIAAAANAANARRGSNTSSSKRKLTDSELAQQQQRRQQLKAEAEAEADSDFDAAAAMTDDDDGDGEYNEHTRLNRKKHKGAKRKLDESAETKSAAPLSFPAAFGADAAEAVASFSAAASAAAASSAETVVAASSSSAAAAAVPSSSAAAAAALSAPSSAVRSRSPNSEMAYKLAKSLKKNCYPALRLDQLLSLAPDAIRAPPSTSDLRGIPFAIEGGLDSIAVAPSAPLARRLVAIHVQRAKFVPDHEVTAGGRHLAKQSLTLRGEILADLTKDFAALSTFQDRTRQKEEQEKVKASRVLQQAASMGGPRRAITKPLTRADRVFCDHALRDFPRCSVISCAPNAFAPARHFPSQIVATFGRSEPVTQQAVGKVEYVSSYFFVYCDDQVCSAAGATADAAAGGGSSKADMSVRVKPLESICSEHRFPASFEHTPCVLKRGYTISDSVYQPDATGVWAEVCPTHEYDLPIVAKPSKIGTQIVMPTAFVPVPPPASAGESFSPPLSMLLKTSPSSPRAKTRTSSRKSRPSVRQRSLSPDEYEPSPQQKPLLFEMSAVGPPPEELLSPPVASSPLPPPAVAAAAAVAALAPALAAAAAAAAAADPPLSLDAAPGDDHPMAAADADELPAESIQRAVKANRVSSTSSSLSRGSRGSRSASLVVPGASVDDSDTGSSMPSPPHPPSIGRRHSSSSSSSSSRAAARDRDPFLLTQVAIEATATDGQQESAQPPRHRSSSDRAKRQRREERPAAHEAEITSAVVQPVQPAEADLLSQFASSSGPAPGTVVFVTAPSEPSDSAADTEMTAAPALDATDVAPEVTAAEDATVDAAAATAVAEAEAATVTASSSPADAETETAGASEAVTAAVDATAASAAAAGTEVASQSDAVAAVEAEVTHADAITAVADAGAATDADVSMAVSAEAESATAAELVAAATAAAEAAATAEASAKAEAEVAEAAVTARAAAEAEAAAAAAEIAVAASNAAAAASAMAAAEAAAKAQETAATQAAAAAAAAAASPPPSAPMRSVATTASAATETIDFAASLRHLEPAPLLEPGLWSTPVFVPAPPVLVSVWTQTPVHIMCFGACCERLSDAHGR